MMIRTLLAAAIWSFFLAAPGGQTALGAPEFLRQAWSFGFASAGPLTFFICEDTTHGRQLWSTDGTPSGTRMLTAKPSQAEYGLAVNDQGQAFFAVDWKPWVSDGTPEGTKAISTLSCGQQVMTVGSKAFFLGSNSFLVTDGTSAGTQILGGFTGTLTMAGVTDRHLFFLCNRLSGDLRVELWRTDGTDGGTIKLAAFQSQYFISDFPKRYSRGNKFYFPIPKNTDQEDLWESDGTTEGTRPLTNVPFVKGHTIFCIVGCGDRLYYIGQEADRSKTLYGCDDSTSGTTTVARLNAGISETPRFSDTAGKFMIFNLGTRTFVSDGTAPGTRQLAFKADKSYYSYNQFVRLPRHPIWFCAGTDSTNGDELWMTDGTDAGSQMICDITPGKPSSDLVQLHVCGGNTILALNYRGSSVMDLWSIPIPEHPNAVRQWKNYH